MTSYLLSIGLSYLLLYKYVALFGALLLTGLILPIPANTLLMAVGAFASQGYFNFYYSIIAALLGNVLGDSVGYYVTKKYGTWVLKKLHLNNLKALKKFEGYIKQNANLTIFLTRFVNSIGSAVNFLAGLINMPYKKFIVFDSMGNLCNILIFLSLGYFLGDEWEALSGIIGLLAVAVIVGICVVLLVRALYKKNTIS